MRIRSLISGAVLAGGLVAGAASPVLAAPSTSAPSTPAAACTLTVTNLYYSIGMQTAFARLSGGCSGPIGITLLRADSPTGTYSPEPDALYALQQASDGTAATAYFTDPEQRGYCKAQATYGSLTALSASPVNC
ncbi:hypothetical protein AB0J86_10805 [Micromonospora sp. NPDC049559]|uniref:hypothetical protein n=1 Tax=Micromonospora sp. NPDC049559 TaxID=3155923 RepID=UPI0034360630